MATQDDAVLVLGLGNRLCSDDAAGALVVQALAAWCPAVPARLLDGGTIGLGLLPDVEQARGLIAVDAARFGAAPGTVRVFEGEAMDRQIGGRKHSAHEVALADLLAAAALTGHLPPQRALVAVEPASTALGLAPTPCVDAALPLMQQAVSRLLSRWRPSTGDDDADPEAAR